MNHYGILIKRNDEYGYLVYNVVEIDSDQHYTHGDILPKDYIMFVPVFDKYEAYMEILGLNFH